MSRAAMGGLLLLAAATQEGDCTMPQGQQYGPHAQAAQEGVCGPVFYCYAAHRTYRSSEAVHAWAKPIVKSEATQCASDRGTAWVLFAATVQAALCKTPLSNLNGTGTPACVSALGDDPEYTEFSELNCCGRAQDMGAYVGRYPAECP